MSMYVVIRVNSIIIKIRNYSLKTGIAKGNNTEISKIWICFTFSISVLIQYLISNALFVMRIFEAEFDLNFLFKLD